MVSTFYFLFPNYSFLVAVLVENCPNDWIKVEFKGKIGVVPKGYVKRVPPPPPPANAKTMIVKSKSKEVYFLLLIFYQ